MSGAAIAVGLIERSTRASVHPVAREPGRPDAGERGPTMARRISRFALQQRSRIDAFRPEDGIRRLMWALLKDTLAAYQANLDGRTVQEQRQFREAERWIESDDVVWVFSYQNVCGVLGIDSDYLRNELHRWRRQQRRVAGRMRS